MKPRAYSFYSRVRTHVGAESRPRRRRVCTLISDDQSMTCSILTIFPDCFRRAINNDNHISSVRVFLPSRVQSRTSSMTKPNECLNKVPPFEVPYFRYRTFVLFRRTCQHRELLAVICALDRRTDRIGTASSNQALLRVAVRPEEGGQVESWVSESVGGAEHA